MDYTLEDQDEIWECNLKAAMLAMNLNYVSHGQDKRDPTKNWVGTRLQNERAPQKTTSTCIIVAMQVKFMIARRKP